MKGGPLMAALFPSYVITVLELFRKHGFEAYVVGGACAICFAESIPMTTILSRAPDRKKPAVFAKGRVFLLWKTWAKNFGVLVLLVEGRAVEVAAYRKELWNGCAPP